MHPFSPPFIQPSVATHNSKDKSLLRRRVVHFTLFFSCHVASQLSSPMNSNLFMYLAGRWLGERVVCRWIKIQRAHNNKKIIKPYFLIRWKSHGRESGCEKKVAESCQRTHTYFLMLINTQLNNYHGAHGFPFRQFFFFFFVAVTQSSYY